MAQLSKQSWCMSSKAKIALIVATLLTGSVANADSGAAKRQLQELYVLKFQCLGTGQGSAKCAALENAYSAAGFGDLAADVSGNLVLTAVGAPYGTLYEISSPQGRLTLTICNIPAGIDRVALWGIATDVPGSPTEFQYPGIPEVNASGCATFTAPFTTYSYLDDFNLITVETFAARTWMFETRSDTAGSYETAMFTIP